MTLGIVWRPARFHDIIMPILDIPSL